MDAVVNKADHGASSSVSPKPGRIGLVAARSKDEARELAVSVAESLTSAGATVIGEDQLGDPRTGTVDAIVVLGGDGLMMRAATAYPDIPLLGINFGNVGFLALVERKDWRRATAALLAGDFRIQEGPTLEAKRDRQADSVPQGWAINDVVVRSGNRMVDVELYIDGYYVNTYPGDGMIVATPHGSTAYCMAAGGPILTAGVGGFAIAPISCHRLVTLGSTNFYEAFRTKFNFRIRPDAVPSRNRS